MLEQLLEKMPAYYQRMPAELQKVFDALPLEMRILVIRELDMFHRTLEEELYRFTLGLIRALR